MDKEQLLADVSENELLKFLGVKVETVSAERVVLTMEVTPRVHQYIGIMNGGVSLLLCETAASNGAVAACRPYEIRTGRDRDKRESPSGSK